MTSANLSWSDKLKKQQKYMTRNLWSSIMAFLFMALYYILCPILLVTRAMNYGKLHNQTAQVLQYEKYNAVTKIMGFEQLGFLIIICIAVVFAFQGFSYVFDQKKIDFYLSQPTTRAQRLWGNYFNAFFTFVSMYVGVEIISLLIVGLMGAVNRYVLISVAIETVRSIILYLSIYNITLIAIFLCGTLPLALLTLMFFTGISLVLGYEIYAYKQLFFATFSDYNSPNIIGSPLFDRVKNFDWLKAMSRLDGHNMSMDAIKNIMGIIWKNDLDTIVVCIISIILLVFLSRYRRAEHAGTTIVLRPFRWLMKVATCIVVGLATGYFVESIYDTGWNNGLYLFMFVMMIFSTVVFGCILEAILESNIRKIFSGKAQTIMAGCIVALVFLIYRGDLIGYDNYIPKKSEISSCAILYDNYNFQMYVDGENIFGDSIEKNMILKSTDDFIEFARIGIKSRKEEFKLEREGKYNYNGIDTTILYRMKNGNMVYRNICIPFDIDENLMSSIVDSDEYKKGYFSVFHDEVLRDFDKENADDSKIIYSTVSNELSSNRIPYEEISDAYRKDVEQYFSYKMAKTSVPVGIIEYDVSTINGYGDVDINVYENYQNTIAVLKKYGIYSEDSIDVQYINSCVVTNYYSGYKSPSDGSFEYPDEEYPTKTVTYTDKEQIRKIIENAHSSQYYSLWYDNNKYEDGQYSIEILTDNSRRSSYLVFELGKVPDFVISDTN